MISIVIASWNDAEYIKKCVNSLLKDDFEKEIIVVDDFGSPEVEFIPEIKYMKTDFNRGPAYAWNMGIIAAKYDKIVVLNPDTEVSDGFCFSLMSNYEKIGHPCILGPSGNLVDTRLRIHVIDNLWQTEEFHRIPVDHIGGFCMFFDKKILSSLDIKFDRGYRLYYEDSDICCQAWNKGLPVYFLNPKLVPIKHEGGGSTGKFKEAMDIMKESRRRFVLKWKHYYRRKEPRGIELIC